MTTDRDRNEQLEHFEAAALPYMKDLFRAAAAILGNRTEAEDVVQQAYLQAWKSFNRFEPGTNCRAWLFKILFHVVSHHRKKLFTWSRLSGDLEAVEETMPAEAPVPEELSDEEVLAAFRELPEAYAEVVMLADVHDYSYKEIGQMLGIPLGTVMSRLSRGRKLLRIHLANFAAPKGQRFGVTPVAEAHTAAAPAPRP